MKKIKFLVLILLLIFQINLLFSATENNDKVYLKNLILKTTNKVLKILNDKKLSEKEKKDKIYKIVNPLFDFNIMARLTLGNYWKKMNEKQQKEFLKLFKKRIRMVYLDRVTLTKVKVKVKPVIQKGKRIIFVPAIFTSEGKDYSTLFKFWKSPHGWKIYDVEIEGVSIVRTYRDQFTEILKKGTVKDLLKKLKSS